MSAQLVTKLSKILPKILLIGDGSTLSLNIANAYKEKKFRLIYYREQDLRNRADLREKFNKHTYYKVIYFFNLLDNTQEVKKVKQILKNRREPILFITRFDTAIQADFPRTHSWFKASLTQYQNINNLVAAFPKASVLIAHDLILDNGWHPARDYFFSRSSEGELLSPGLGFSFISQSSFFAQIQSLLFSAFSGEKMMLITNKITPKSIFLAFSELKIPPFKIITHQLEAVDFEFNFPLIVYSGVSDLNFVKADHSFFQPLLQLPTPKAHLNQPLKRVKKHTDLSVSNSQAAVNKSTKIPNKKQRQIISRAKAILTHREEGFLHRYSKTSPQQNFIPINLTNFDFLPTISRHHSSLFLPNFNLSQQRLKQLKIPPVVIWRQAPESLHLGQNIINLPIITTASAVKKPPIAKTLSRPVGGKPASKKYYFCWREFFSRLTKPAIFLLMPLIIISLSVVIYTHWRQTKAQHLLANFFQTCTSTSACLATNQLSLLNTSDLSPSVATDFLQALHYYIQTEDRLNSNLGRLGKWFAGHEQLTTNQFISELKTTINQAQESEKQLQSLLENHSSTLSSFATTSNWQIFLKQVQSSASNKRLLIEYTPLLETLLQNEQLLSAQILFDNFYTRRGGGTIYGFTIHSLASKNLPQIYSLSEIASASAIKINLPEKINQQLSIENNPEIGLKNLAFDRSFFDVAALSQQLLSSATKKKPNLIWASSFAANQRLTQVLLGDQQALALANLQQQPIANASSRENALISNLKAQNSRFLNGDEQLLSKYIYEFLNLLNEGEIFLYSPNEKLANLIASLRLDDDLRNIACPASFASKTCFLDSFAQHDNYLQAGALLTQTAVHTIELESATTKHQRRLVFDNTKGTQDLVDYLSFTLPNQSRLESVIIDEVAHNLDQNYGLMVVVPAGKSANVELTFSVDRAISENDLTYSFYNHHQFGLNGQKTQVIINNRLPYRQKIIAPAAINEQKSIIFNTLIGRSFQGAVVF